MNLKDYAENSVKTLADSVSNYPNDIHMVLGIMTEAGEIADAYKKNTAYGKDVDWVNVKEEIGDIMWYISNLCTMRGWDLEEILGTNIDKLKTRYGDKFSEERANKRNLSREREILEGMGYNIETNPSLRYKDITSSPVSIPDSEPE